MFADDLLLFCKANEQSVAHIRDKLEMFSQASVLVANLKKSAIYFGGVEVRVRQKLMSILAMPKGELPF